MEEKAYPIGELMRQTMEHMHTMGDADTIIGTPIRAGEVTLIPVSRVSAGFGCGSVDLSSKGQKENKDSAAGTGGGGAGVNIDPVAFLVVRGDNVRLLPILPPATGAVDRAVELLPEVMDKITDYLDKRKEKKDTEHF